MATKRTRYLHREDGSADKQTSGRVPPSSVRGYEPTRWRTGCQALAMRSVSVQVASSQSIRHGTGDALRFQKPSGSSALCEQGWGASGKTGSKPKLTHQPFRVSRVKNSGEFLAVVDFVAVKAPKIHKVQQGLAGAG